MNKLLYKKIENCIRDKMHQTNTHIRDFVKDDAELTSLLCMLVIGLCADISMGIKHILEKDINNA